MIVFDLDDTLYPECQFVESGREYLTSNYPGIDIDGKWSDEMLEAFRNHHPKITLSDDARQTLQYLYDNSYPIGIITDGRSITQRNKISALSLNRFIDDNAIIISGEMGYDKFTPYPFLLLMKRFPDQRQWVYIADNPDKDFFYPNQLGWRTIMLVDGNRRNIHPQTMPTEKNKCPQFMVYNLYEILPLIKVKS